MVSDKSICCQCRVALMYTVSAWEARAQNTMVSVRFVGWGWQNLAWGQHVNHGAGVARHVIHTRHLDILKMAGFTLLVTICLKFCLVYNAWLCQPISGYTYAWVGRCSLLLACGPGTKRITWYCLMCGQGICIPHHPVCVGRCMIEW